MSKYTCVIPARMASSRFKGKPLTEICGKPMITLVAEHCAEYFGKDVVIATPDNKIIDEVDKRNFRFVATSNDCLTGADRVGEASHYIDSEYFVSIQGDEPCITANDIEPAVEMHLKHQDCVVNCMAITNRWDEIHNKNCIKMAVNDRNDLLYASRSPIPVDKNMQCQFTWKQVCISVYSRTILQKYFGKNKHKSMLEKIEDIDMLRFLENRVPVKMAIVSNCKHAVDVPEDVPIVERILTNEHKRPGNETSKFFEDNLRGIT